MLAARHVMMLLMMCSRMFQQANRNCTPVLLTYMAHEFSFRCCCFRARALRGSNL
jgi:hypothetical protein